MYLLDYRSVKIHDSDAVLEAQMALVKESILTMTIFNIATARSVFAQKLLALLASIFGMYFFVRLVFIEPVAAVFFFTMLAEGSTFYSVLYGYVDSIPESIQTFKRELNIKAATRGRQSGYLKRVGNSMRCVGLQVGSFRNMERDSTLIFIDFVSSNVGSLLISY